MISQLLSRLRMRQHLAAQQAAAALRYQSMGMPGQGMPMAQQPYAYPHMGMGGMYGAPQPQPQLQYGGPYGSQGGVGLPHQAHQAAPYTGPQLQFQPPPRKRLLITNPDTGQEVPMPPPAGLLPPHLYLPFSQLYIICSSAHMPHCWHFLHTSVGSKQLLLSKPLLAQNDTFREICVTAMLLNLLHMLKGTKQCRLHSAHCSHKTTRAVLLTLNAHGGWQRASLGARRAGRAPRRRPGSRRHRRARHPRPRSGRLCQVRPAVGFCIFSACASPELSPCDVAAVTCGVNVFVHNSQPVQSVGACSLYAPA